MNRRRPLSAEELELWRHVTRSVAPFDHAQPPRSASVTEDADAATPEPEAIAHNVKRRAPPTPASPPSPLIAGREADMDRRTAWRFKRGELAIEARLDLHGLTLREAHNDLASFVRASASRGLRCVMVVTGKGGPHGEGKIRRELPLWLNQPSLRPHVLALSEARIRHGGAGAFYVLLKRKR